MGGNYFLNSKKHLEELLVSIIIPAKDEEKYIKEFSLSSIKNQTYENLETIVVCNACTDKTADVVKDFWGKIKDLKLLETEKAGVSYARNLGAQCAHGNMFVFLDADVAMAPNAIEEIVKAKKDYENIIGICKGYPNEKSRKATYLIAAKNIFFRPLILSNGLIFCNRRLYYKIGGFDEDLKRHEDGKFIREGFKYYTISPRKNKYIYLKKTYVKISMRRFEKKGYVRTMFGWLRPVKDYPIVR